VDLRDQIVANFQYIDQMVEKIPRLRLRGFIFVTHKWMGVFGGDYHVMNVAAVNGERAGSTLAGERARGCAWRGAGATGGFSASARGRQNAAAHVRRDWN